MSKIVDARGDACPIPVIKTKGAIKEAAPKDVIEVLVDNEIAVQNVSKMAAQLGLAVTSEAKGEKEFSITITLGDTLPNMSAAGGDACGITGDTEGFFLQLCECVMVLAVLIGQKVWGV